VLKSHSLEGNQENSTIVTMVGNYGDRGPQEIMKPGFLAQKGEPEEVMVVQEDEGEWLEASDEFILVDYTKIADIIQVFKT